MRAAWSHSAPTGSQSEFRAKWCVAAILLSQQTINNNILRHNTKTIWERERELTKHTWTSVSLSASVFLAATTTNLALSTRLQDRARFFSNLNISQILSNFHEIKKYGSSGVVTCLDGARDKKKDQYWNVPYFHGLILCKGCHVCQDWVNWTLANHSEASEQGQSRVNLQS